MSSVQGVALDRFGNMYVADTNGHRITIITPNCSFITSFDVFNPYIVCVDLQGRIMVASESRSVLVFGFDLV